jgi:hypothetical protein
VPNANDATRPATLTVRLDQFSSLEEFARGYRQHVTRTTLYLPTRLQRPEGSLLLFRIELAGGMCAFRGEGAVESYRRTPGGEQLGMMLRLRRLDKASKELHTSAFAGVQESTAPAAERGDPMAEIGSLLAAVGAAGEDALASLASEAAAGPARERAVVSRNEGDAPLQMRDDLRAHSRSAHEVVTRPLDAAALALVESEAGEQPQSVGRMAVSRMSRWRGLRRCRRWLHWYPIQSHRLPGARRTTRSTLRASALICGRVFR